MKRFVISIILIALCLAVCLIETVYLEKSLNTVSHKIDVLKTKIEENINISTNDTDEVLNYWEKRSDFLMHFIDREQLNSLTKKISELENCNHINKQQLLIVINNIEDEINDFKNKQGFNIKYMLSVQF